MRLMSQWALKKDVDYSILSLVIATGAKANSNSWLKSAGIQG